MPDTPALSRHAAPTTRQRASRQAGGIDNTGYWHFIWPTLVALVATTLVPILFTLAIALHHYEPADAWPFQFVGLENLTLLWEDARYLNSLRVMLILIFVPVALQVVLGMALAMAMKEKLYGTRWMRTAFLLPAVIPPAVSGILWKLFVVPKVGGLAYMASIVGMQFNADLLGNPGNALWVVVVASTWLGTPFVALLFLSALESIPADLYEASMLDGASWLRAHGSISLPIMRPVVLTVVVFRVLEALAMFPIIFVLTGGGPAGATEPVNYYAYVTGFEYLKVGYAAAIIVTFFVILMGFCTPFLVRMARSTP